VKLTFLRVKQLIASFITHSREYHNLSNTKCWGQGFIAAFIYGDDQRSFPVAAEFMASYNKCYIFTKILQQIIGCWGYLSMPTANKTAG